MRLPRKDEIAEYIGTVVLCAGIAYTFGIKWGVLVLSVYVCAIAWYISEQIDEGA